MRSSLDVIAPTTKAMAQNPPHRVAAAALRLLLEPWRSLQAPGLPIRNLQRIPLPDPQKPVCTHGTSIGVIPHCTPSFQLENGLQGPRLCVLPTVSGLFDFGQEGTLGQLWSGQSLTSPRQENLMRTSIGSLPSWIQFEGVTHLYLCYLGTC